MLMKPINLLQNYNRNFSTNQNRSIVFSNEPKQVSFLKWILQHKESETNSHVSVKMMNNVVYV